MSLGEPYVTVRASGDALWDAHFSREGIFRDHALPARSEKYHDRNEATDGQCEPELSHGTPNDLDPLSQSISIGDIAVGVES